MKQYLILYIFCLLAAFIACKKENSIPADVPSPTDTIPSTAKGSGLLIKTFSSGSPTDSLVYYFTYDAAKRLIKSSLFSYDYSGATPQFGKGGTTYYRDDLGRVILQASLNAPLPDSSYTYFYYPVSSLLPSYTLQANNVRGVTNLDSTVYSYNDERQLIKKQVYYSADWPSIPLSPGTYELYENDAAGNIIQWDTYSPYPGGIDSLIFSITYTYDNKKSPSSTGSFNPWSIDSTTNNCIVQKVRGAIGILGGYTENTSTNTYTYDGNDKPLTVTTTSTGSSTIIRAIYYYDN